MPVDTIQLGGEHLECSADMELKGGTDCSETMSLMHPESRKIRGNATSVIC